MICIVFCTTNIGRCAIVMEAPDAEDAKEKAEAELWELGIDKVTVDEVERIEPESKTYHLWDYTLM